MRFKDKPKGGGGSPPCSSLKSFHKEYPSFQPTFKSTCSPLLLPSSSPPLPPSLSLPRFFVLSSTCPRLDVPLFHSRYRFRVYLQGFFFPAPIVFRYFAFLRARVTDKAPGSRRIRVFPSMARVEFEYPRTDWRKRIVFPVLEIVRLLDSPSYFGSYETETRGPRN